MNSNVTPVAIVSVCIAFTGLMITLISKLMNMSVKYGELVKQQDLIASNAKAEIKAVIEDVKELQTRTNALEDDVQDQRVVMARLDQNMLQLVTQITQFGAKLDKISDKLAEK